MAQGIGRQPPELKIAGSNPAGRTKHFLTEYLLLVLGLAPHCPKEAFFYRSNALWDGPLNRQIVRTKANAIFWGWYVVFGTFMLMVISYGVRYSFGVFVKPMFAEYNWPMTIIQLGASINLVTYAFSSILAGRLLDRFAPRWIMTAGILLTSAGLFLAGQVATPLGLYLSYGVLVGAGTAGCGMVVNSVTVAKWFNRYRGLAIGISSMGIGIGTMLMAPLAGDIVKHLG